MYKDGDRKKDRYMGERTLVDLEAYVLENLKAHGIKDELWKNLWKNHISQKKIQFGFPQGYIW